MEEGLATAAGQWSYAKLTGQPEAETWYLDAYIDRYAHALYPLLSGYLDRGQQIDSTFVNQVVTTFDRAFPQAATEYTNLFRNVLYWGDAEPDQAIEQPFRERFSSTVSVDSSPILGKTEALAEGRKYDCLPVILVTKQHAATLRYLRQQLPALRRYRLHPERSFLLAATGPTGPLVLVCAHSAEQLTKATELLAKQGHIDPAAPLTKL